MAKPTLAVGVFLCIVVRHGDGITLDSGFKGLRDFSGLI